MSYDFSQTDTTPESCVGVVKAIPLHKKNPTQHISDLWMLSKLPELQHVFLKSVTNQPKISRSHFRMLKCLTHRPPSHKAHQMPTLCSTAPQLSLQRCPPHSPSRRVLNTSPIALPHTRLTRCPHYAPPPPSCLSRDARPTLPPGECSSTSPIALPHTRLIRCPQHAPPPPSCLSRDARPTLPPGECSSTLPIALPHTRLTRCLQHAPPRPSSLSSETWPQRYRLY